MHYITSPFFPEPFQDPTSEPSPPVARETGVQMRQWGDGCEYKFENAQVMMAGNRRRIVKCSLGRVLN